jgi:hypothetical protein
MTAQIMHEVLRLIEADIKSRPSAAEFEMAYQARVAIDRIRFAIRHTEQFAPHTDQMREAGLQLLDALKRLESADRNFQNRFRPPPDTVSHIPEGNPVNGTSDLGKQDGSEIGSLG